LDVFPNPVVLLKAGFSILMKPLLVNIFLLLSLSLWTGTGVTSSGPARVIDETGREVIIPPSPERIISLAPNITEILFTLGLDREIVGVSTHCNFPEAAKRKPRVGSYISLDFEKILSLRPDLVLATGAGNTIEMVERLEKLGFPTYVIYPKNFDGILASIRHVGQILGRDKEAQEIVSNMQARRQRVIELTRGLPRPRVFLQIGEAPIVTVGKGSFADDLIHLAGGENITAGDGKMYPRLGLEEILRRAPEVIIISSMNPRGSYDKVLQEWARWKTIPAVQNGRIHLVDSDLIDRPSPRIIDGLEEMARIIHPEKFKK
jgi:iron complex transport system substrate-binding protein